jgi:hypothetical protein
MARKATEYVETNPVVMMPDEALHEAHSETLANEAELEHIKAGYTEDRDLANQLLGQAQMANAIAKFSDVVTLSKLQQIKENKLYRALAGKKAFSPDGEEISDVGTFEGFCRVLGLSYSKVHEDLQNLTTFGETALQNLSRLGVGYRELRKYRKLPEDQRTALIEAAKSGDKDTLLELAEDLIVKHAKEKEALTKQVTELTADAEATSRLMADKNTKLDELTKIRSAISPTEEKVGVFKAEIAAGFDVLETTISQLYLVHGAILKEDVQWGDSDDAERLILRQFATLFGDRLNRAAQQLAELCDTYEATLAGWGAELDGRVLNPFPDANASGDEA